MIHLHVSKKIAEDKRHFLKILNEALSLLHWQKKHLRCSLFISYDSAIRKGSGKVSHRHGRHNIKLNQVQSQPFPFNTVRHEFLHSLLKSKIRTKLKQHSINLPVNRDYKLQIFRDNLEEYFVRSLNSLFLCRKLGNLWLKKQIVREVKNGFVFMPLVIRFIQQWNKSGHPFSRTTFYELMESLEDANSR